MKKGISLHSALKRQREDSGEPVPVKAARTNEEDDDNRSGTQVASEESVDLVYPFNVQLGGGGTKLSVQQPLAFIQSTLALKYNSDDFEVDSGNGQLKLKRSSAASTESQLITSARLVLGDASLGEHVGQFMDQAQSLSKMNYYFCLVYNYGLVQGMMNFRIKASDYPCDGASIKATVCFNAKGSLDADTNFSSLGQPITTPEDSLEQFVPQHVNDSLVMIPLSSTEWYHGVGRATTSYIGKFRPFGVDVEFGESTYAFTDVDISNEDGSVCGSCIMISLEMPIVGGSWNGNPIAQVTTGPLFFSYQGQL